jgi:2-polyprenyl-3-methyl-5-hydroxy-6-metoxy-1,4-benzoquinol methylase
MLANFGLPKCYQSRLDNADFDDTPFADEYQRNVYEYAARLAKLRGYRNIVDIGCGSGFKLVKHFSDVNTIGLDIPKTIEYCRQKYPHRRWREINTEDIIAGSDLVISADVIEHVPNPDDFMQYIKALHPKAIVISTPARDLLQLSTEELMGPPRNIHHAREWSSREFRAYIGQWFSVEEHLVGMEHDTHTQLIMARGK